MINIISSALILSGFFFFFATTVGILRFPDFYSRMHAAGKGDTLSSSLILLGLILFNMHHLSLHSGLVSMKIIFILLFIFLASPTATHAIIDAGFESGVMPWEKEASSKENADDMAT
jgi:multicomponent Na+:H+ antiporter subunit G